MTATIFARSLRREDVVSCAVVAAEQRYGLARDISGAGKAAALEAFLSQFELLSFDATAAVEYASIRSDLEARGIPIGPHDCMIAAIARAHGCGVVTANTREFMRVPRLTVETW